MPNRLANRLTFILERLILRGAHYRLLVIAGFLGVIVLTAGLLVYSYTEGFDTLGEAIWWAFLRMTDPGYLGDDEGAFLRTVSTGLTITGFVIFVGALIAILTQWLNETIETLEGGHTPVVLRGHVVVLGWTNRTAAVVQQLVLSEGRLRRFLLRHRTRGLRIAILADSEPTPLLRELRERLGPHWDERQIILRSGTPLRLEHLRRVDFQHASAILLPGADFAEADAGSDTQVIKTLLSMANHPALDKDLPALPLVVAEVADANKAPIARRAYSGRIELLTSDAIVSRLIAQNVRHPGLSHVYDELLSHRHGNELYVRECPQFAGRHLHALHHAFPKALLLGVARRDGDSYRPVLNPPMDFTVATDDRLVLLAREYDDATPLSGIEEAPIEKARIDDASEPKLSLATPSEHRVLLLGWNHRVPALLREFDRYHTGAFRVDLLSLVPIAERERMMGRYGVRLEHVSLEHIEGDYNAPPDLRRVEPETYDNIVLLGSDWLESGTESDARTILGHLLLREMLPSDSAVGVVIELLDPENLSLFHHRSTEVLISPLILSHMLAQVVLRPELRAVFDELFGPGGQGITFAPVADYGTTGEAVRFGELQRHAARQGAMALGVRLAPRSSPPGTDDTRARIELNPSRSGSWTLDPRDQLILLAPA